MGLQSMLTKFLKDAERLKTKRESITHHSRHWVSHQKWNWLWLKKKKNQVSMLLKLLLQYLYWKTHAPHITFFKLCLMDNMFLFYFRDLTSDIFTGPKIAQWANKKLHVIRKTNPILRKLHRYAMFLTILFIFFFFYPGPHLLTLTMVLPGSVQSGSLSGC